MNFRLINATIAMFILMSCQQEDMRNDSPKWTEKSGQKISNVIDIPQTGTFNTYICSNYKFRFSEVNVNNVVYLVDKEVKVFDNGVLKVNQTANNSIEVSVSDNDFEENRTITITGDAGDVFPSLTLVQEGGNEYSPTNSGTPVWNPSVLTYFIANEYQPVLPFSKGTFSMRCLNYNVISIRKVTIDSTERKVADGYEFQESGINVKIDKSNVVFTVSSDGSDERHISITLATGSTLSIVSMYV